GDGPNPQTPAGGVGLGGAGGAEGAGGFGGVGDVSHPLAGENCAVNAECSQGQCIYNGLVPGSDAVVMRDGFSVQCKEWTGDVCIRPWIQVPLSAVVDPMAPNQCIDDSTSLRPVWFYGGGDEEAQTFCWIATGTSQYTTV